MREILREAMRGQDGFVELRWHAKVHKSVVVENGRIERSVLRRRSGVGVRVLEEGTWGFAATSEPTSASVRAAIEAARRGARASAPFRRTKVGTLSTVGLAQGSFEGPGLVEVMERSHQEQIELIIDTEASIRRASTRIRSASSVYNQLYEQKTLLTSDGADASWSLVRPELYLMAVAEKDGQLSQVSESIGVTGGWRCLFRTAPSLLAERVASMAIDLLDARRPEGGRATVIMAPSIVGLLVHEAVGHTVEADFVAAGSVAAGKLGQRVASELVTLTDSGISLHHEGAGGSLPVDDEGVLAGKTVVIREGILESYLHSRESATAAGVDPTGNARAWEYADQPLIRMRNTSLEPGESELEEMIASTQNGWLLEGPRNGQADATGEFTFGITRARRITNGRLGELVRGVTITGNAFEVLSTVDAVSREFVWDLGAGHCGKGQPAKVDAGGPWIRCRAMLGGEQR